MKRRDLADLLLLAAIRGGAGTALVPGLWPRRPVVAAEAAEAAEKGEKAEAAA